MDDYRADFADLDMLSDMLEGHGDAEELEDYEELLEQMEVQE